MQINYKTISIIIQARSTSQRFPGKIFAKIGAKQVLQHVIDACNNSASYVNAYTHKHKMVCNVALVIPENDGILKLYSKQEIIQGSEADVLGRYKKASDQLGSDYVVRITSDCPFVPPYVISKAINIAVDQCLDFLTNADPRFRTAPDGHDVEVISKRLLDWLDENAKDPVDREHVTSHLTNHLPDWAQKADIVGFVDMFTAGIKLSVDTREDLDRLKAMHDRIYAAVNNSPRAYRL
jgi:spore coat polysaccharide biosynthesis protein SpsF